MIDDQIADFFFNFESSFLDVVFAVITFIGDELFYIMFFSLMFWVYDKELAYELIYVLLISISINGSLKELFTRTRPTFEVAGVDQIGKGVVEAEGYSFPSGHAQNAAMIWGSWALSLKNHKKQLILAILIILIGFSRIYLAVHFFTDVIAGWSIGLVVAYFIYKAKPSFLEKWHKLSSKARLSIIAVLSLILLAISLLSGTSESFSKTLSTGAGILIGIHLGKNLESKYVGFNAKEGLKSISVFMIRFVTGFVLSGLTYFGLKVLFTSIDDGNIILRFIRYFSVGFMGIFLVPYLFNLMENKMNLITKPTEAT
jgi:membrane-associated phospholipid phosphatase